MQQLQREWMDQAVVSRCSSPRLRRVHSYLTPEESRSYLTRLKNNAQPPCCSIRYGNVSRLYGVTTALHMVIIDPAGKVIYNGGIDNKPTTNAAEFAGTSIYSGKG